MDHHGIPGADVWPRLRDGVVRPGLCTHCGTCAGLSGGKLVMRETPHGPLPFPRTAGDVMLTEAAIRACPGRGVDYPALFRRQFGELPQNWLLGPHQGTYIGYASDDLIRRGGASGGVITQALVYLLTSGKVDGAVVVRQGSPVPWEAEPIIAEEPGEILAASQSVYRPVPVNSLLNQIDHYDGRLAFVGLPDQVASIRCLQTMGHPGVQKIKIILGPYTGTNMYFGAIRSFLRAHRVRNIEEIADLKYREGEWPGNLQIKLRDGRVLQAEKFYYNYLIPFYITQSTLLSADFTNELADISVGDAWSPHYEALGQGFSVVVARSEQGQVLLEEMSGAGLLSLEPVPVGEVLNMHGHMLDFKKRGSFIRNGWRKSLGRPAPDYGYRPLHIPLSRRLTELVIALLFAIAGTRPARWLAEITPISILGPVFNSLRKAWKDFSKPAKREGLHDYEVTIG